MYLIKKSDFDFAIKVDWKRYELVLYNLIQNAIKFNKNQGDIIIVFALKLCNFENVPNWQNFYNEDQVLL